MKKNNFKKFISPKSRSVIPKARIYKTGILSLNKAAVRQYKLDFWKGFVYFYDKERNTIGLEFTNDERKEGFYKLFFRGRALTAGAKGFMGYFNIQPFEQKELKHLQDNFYYIDLKE